MKRSAILAWALCLLIILLATWQLLANGRSWLDMPFIQMLAAFFWGWIFPVLFAVMGALIIAHQPGNRVGWLLMLPALPPNFMSLVEPIFAEPPADPTALYWLVLWVYNWSWIAIFFPILLLPLNFPNGRPPSPRWRWLNWLAVFMWALFAFVAAFLEPIGPFPQDPSWRIANPVGFLPEAFFNGPVSPLWVLGLIVLALGSVVSLIQRYRRAGFVEKEQIKWLLYATTLFGLAYTLYTLVQSSLPGEYGDLLFMITLPLLPVAITAAILRYRLFDIDIIIRKTAVYGVLTVMLGLVYFGTILLLQTLFGEMLGEQSTLILVVSTLFIAALFSPLRRWVQNVIDRRFYRRKYDAQQVLAHFAQVARSETDLANLSGELLSVLAETFHPQSVGLWTAPSGEGLPRSE
jgi:hypothetical protein